MWVFFLACDEIHGGRDVGIRFTHPVGTVGGVNINNFSAKDQ